MASRRRIPRKGGDRPEKARRELKHLTRSAKSEVARLLKHNRAGDITRGELETRLEEVHGQLQEMWVFLFKV